MEHITTGCVPTDYDVSHHSPNVFQPAVLFAVPLLAFLMVIVWCTSLGKEKIAKLFYINTKDKDMSIK